MPRLTSKSRYSTPVGKMGSGRPMSRGSRPGSRLSPKASMKSLASGVKSKLSQRRKSAGAVTRPSMAKGGLNPRARMAQMRRARA